MNVRLNCRMVESKAKFGGTALLTGLTAFALFIFIGAIDKFLLTEPINQNGLIFSGVLFVIFSTLFYGLLKDTKKIRNKRNTISYVNWLTQHVESYNIDELEGYVEQYQPSSVGSYATIFLVKDGRLFGKTSSFYYSNYSKLKSALERSNLKYLGNKPFGPITNFKILFGMKVME